MKIHLDFETYSDLDLKEVGAFKYAEHPSTLVLILAYQIGNKPIVVVDMTDRAKALSQLQPFFYAVSQGHTVCAHNAQFERMIWEKTCKDFPVTPKPMQWNCTAARCRLIALPGGLDYASKALKLAEEKDSAGLSLINLFSKPVKGRRVLPHEQPERFAEFMRYCGQDVAVEAAIDKIVPDMPPQEARIFALDYTINDRGMPVNMARVNAANDYVGQYSERLQDRAMAISGCRPTQREKTLEFLRSRGWDLPNLQAATVEEFALTPGLDPDLVELMDARIELSRAGTKKLQAIINRVSDDGRVRGGFLYSAATTRRWSSVGVQLHNLQKPEGETHPEVVHDCLEEDPAFLESIFSRPLTALAQSIRGFFQSDQKFLVADYSAVEPRGLAWIAGEEWILDAYRHKKDLYKITAAKVFGGSPEEVDSGRRFFGKQLVLGCGYMMGGPRFNQTCAKWGRPMSEEDARDAVMGYRQSVPNIVRLWYGVEEACIRAVKTGKIATYRSLLFEVKSFSKDFNILQVTMPSGPIYYPLPFLGEEEWNGRTRETFNFYSMFGSAWLPTDTFGGSLVENIVQALTRDILRDGMLAADKAGFNLVGHCHDEAIAEGDYTASDQKDFEHILCSSSPWAKDLPIAAEGYIDHRYKK